MVFSFGPYPLISWKEFDNFFEDFGTSKVWTCSEGFPKIDQYEDKSGNLVIKMPLAGYGKDKLSVKYDDNTITIKADKIEGECTGGCIAQRAFTKQLVDSVGIWDLSKSKCSYKDGLLVLTIPKKKEKELNNIEIE